MDESPGHQSRSRALRPSALVLAALVLLGGSRHQESHRFRFREPRPEQLSLPGAIEVALRLPRRTVPGTLAIFLDGVLLDPGLLPETGGWARGVLADLSEGEHELRASVELDLPKRARHHFPPLVLETVRRFQVVALHEPEVCEVLNDVECLLPYPSSRFLEPAPTPTGYRVALPEVGMPRIFGTPISPDPLRELDGFGPGVNPLLFFPGGVDLRLSRAPQLDPRTRTFDARSLDADSPTLLVDARTGERILHFVELDARTGVSLDPTRQVMFLRPGRTLTPGRRYIVAVRNLVHPDGTPVEAEPVFAALRDRRPTTIPAVEARRRQHEKIFRALRRAGVRRRELILAFDFVVQSRETLTGTLLAMRDRAFAWLDAQQAAGVQTFEVTSVEEHDCAGGGLWRDVQGSFRVPLFLTLDPLTQNREPGFLLRDPAGLPAFEEVADARFTVLVPCAVLEPGASVRPLLHAHAGGGDFREARRLHDIWNGITAPGVPDRDSPLVAPRYVVGGTDNHGFGQLEFEGLGESFLFKLFFQAGAASALTGRIHQGQVNLLVLGRLMKRGLLNADAAFRTPDGRGVFPGPGEDLYVWGVSFGGFSSLIHAAISPDVDRAVAAVAVVNFANQAQRDTVLDGVDFLLPIALGPDSLTHALTIAISHDLWAQADPVGYIAHVTRDPLPGSRAKPVLLPIGWLDQKSPNVFSDVAARDLGLASLEGSFRRDLVGIRDRRGPLESAYVAYAPSLDADKPAHEPYLPPLANDTAVATACDPHVITWLTPAFLEQVGHFLQPHGSVESFCEGPCDGAEPREREFGNAERCDPTAP